MYPVAYGSRGLRKSERNMSNYSSRKLELLALKWAVTEQFKNYLAGGKFVVLTDNNPLVHLKTAKLGAVESRWLGDLGRFDFEVKYRPGKENSNADGLSRRPHETEEEKGEEIREVWENPPSARVAVIKVWDNVQSEQMRDTQKGCPVLGKLWMQMIGKLHVKELKELLQTEDFRQYWRVRRKLIMRNRVIYWAGDKKNRSKWRVVLPRGQRKEEMRGAHDEWGHQGVARTTALVNRKFAWPGLHEDVRMYVAGCKTCAMAKEEGSSAKTRLGTIEASRPWEVLAMDFTVLEPARDGKENVLVVTDVFSKFALAFPTKNQKATTVGKILVEEVFNRFGCPDRVHSDQGRNFEGQLVQELCKYYQVKKSRTTPYHPQGNGVCERFNRTMHGMLATLCREQREQWPKYLSSLTAIYNSTPHAVTGFSPHYLVFGVEPHLPMDRFTVGTEEAAVSHHQWVKKLRDTQQEAWKAAKENIKQYNESNRKRRQEQAVAKVLQEGQRVLLRDHSVIGRNKIHPKFAEEVWVIAEVLDEASGVYRVRPEDEQSYEKVLHRSNLRPLESGYCEDVKEQPEQSQESQQSQEGLIAEGSAEEEELEMPDMTEVLKRFGFNEESHSSMQNEEEGEVRRELTPIPEGEEFEEEVGQERKEDEVVEPEIREPVRLRRSRRLAEQGKRNGHKCVGCEGFA